MSPSRATAELWHSFVYTFAPQPHDQSGKLCSWPEPPLLAITPESPTDGHGVDFAVKLLLKLVVGWINAHPQSPFSRFMTKQRGPRTDVARMTRVQRLASALVFLLWGCLFLGTWLLAAYLTFA